MKTIDELIEHLNSCPQGGHEWDKYKEPDTDHEMEAYWLGIRKGFGCAAALVRMAQPALEAGMRGTLRFRIVKDRMASIWYAELINTNGKRVECNSGPVKFMAYKKGDAEKKAIVFAESFGLTAEFVEEESDGD